MDKRKIDPQAKKICDDNENTIGTLLSGKDLTSHTSDQQKLIIDLNLSRAVLHNIPEINVFLFDKDLRFIITEGLEIPKTGLSGLNLEGNTLYDLPNNRIKNKWIPLFKKVLTGEIVKEEYRFKNNNFLIKINPLKDADDKIILGLAVIRDITGEKLYKKILSKAKDEAVKSEKLKTQFLARVTHEIRTPLNAIMGFTEQLLQTKLTVKQKEYVSIIDKSSEHLLSLVNDILILSKIEANQLNFESSPFKLEDVIKYAHSALLEKANNKNLGFTYIIEDNTARIIVGDQFRLQQILINLLDNAIKFTNRGSVRLKCSVHSESKKKIILKFDIYDTGIGISSENLKYIFNQYSQSISGTGKHNEGVGLGLAICKNLIELHNGTLTISSQEGSGTTLSFTIPYSKAKNADLAAFNPDKPDTDKLKNKKVLLVDDDSVNLLLGKAILEKLSCSLEIANNGNEAISKLDKGKYDIILLDIYMPDISGIEVAKYLRKKKKDKDTKILALTAAAVKDDIMKFRKNGIDDYLIKPFREINLYNKMCEVLKLTIKPLQKSKSEIILKREISPKPYSINELKEMAGGDEVFIEQTLNIFFENSENAVRNFRKLLKEKNWKEIGELAHKLLPSFRHLEINSVITRLIELKVKTLIDMDYSGVNKLVSETISEIENVIKEMKN